MSDITNSVKSYVECASNPTITDPVNGGWLSAFAIQLGQTAPVNGSWLQAVCVGLGITAPVNGSWVIALANHYGVTQPLNGTWWYAIQDDVCNGVPTDLIWNLAQALWNNETEQWKTATAPAAPTNDGGTFSTSLPTITGTGTTGLIVNLTVDGTTYIDIPVVAGVWSFTVTTPLGGSISPGTAYPVTTTQKDTSTGLVSAADVTNINIISTATSVTFDLFDSYGDGWNDGWMKLQQDIAGVWTDVDLPNYQTYGRYSNAAYTGPFQTYYNQNIYPTGSTGMIFEQNDPLSAPPNSPARSWTQLIDTYIFDLDPADYRLVSVAPGNYTNERTVTVKETIGGTVLATVPSNANWGASNTLATFTIT